MTKITIGEAMQDESFFFDFILNNPKHGVVLSLINGAIKSLSKELQAAVQQRDVAKQSDLHKKCKFLCLEAHDRVYIREEHSMADALEWIHGGDALKTLLAQQKQKTLALMANLRLEMNFSQSSIERQLWEAGVFGTRPAWDAADGKANTSIPCAVRARRLRIYELSLAMTAAFNGNRRKETRDIKLQLDAAHNELNFLSAIGFKTSTFHVARDIYSKDACLEIVSFMDAHSKIPELRKLRAQCKESQYKGRLLLSAQRSTRSGSGSGAKHKEAA